MAEHELETFLNKKVKEYDRASFIENDPVCIPHSFTLKQDIEISGFFAAIFAWGNRKTIINKSRELMKMMDDSPYDFCLNHSDDDLKSLLSFKHRTFNATDLLYFVAFFKMHFKKHNSLEFAFTHGEKITEDNTTSSLNNFYSNFFSLEDVPQRTRKHISAPWKKGSCKRLSMYLRWMVRKSEVDLGLWKDIRPSQLVIPLDVHVARVSRQFKLLQRPATDWQAALELTSSLKKFDKADPCKYDFALFALGVLEKY